MIRISGQDAVTVAEKIFFPRSGKMLSAAGHGRTVYGDIFMPNAERKTEIDDGMAVVFYAPHSFTGENTVEITCHGGILVTQKVLSAVLCAGARLAEAGEFTRRAYVLGKMKLNEAQSLGNLLEAKSDGQLILARAGLKGKLSEGLEKLYSSLLRVLSGLYAFIDFPDEDLSEISREEMLDELEAVYAGTSKLAATYSTGRAVAEGIPTVICGRANAGKSSVYNRLLGYEAAIVTDIEGTTRDILRENAVLGKVTLLLSDTAGLRDTEDKVESIGIERTVKEIEKAKLALLVLDGSKSPRSEDRELVDKLIHSGITTIALINKTDLELQTDTVELARALAYSVNVSAANGEGFVRLTELIEELFIDGNIDISCDAVVVDARQYAALMNASDILKSVVEDIKRGVSLDACCVGVECAMSALGEIDGREVGENIVSEIFSKFCVGK